MGIFFRLEVYKKVRISRINKGRVNWQGKGKFKPSWH